MQGLRSTLRFFIIWLFFEIQSIQTLLLGCHCLILLRSQILHDLHENNRQTAPQCNSRSSVSATPGVVLRTKRIEKVELPEFQNTTPGVSEINSRSLKRPTPRHVCHEYGFFFSMPVTPVQSCGAPSPMTFRATFAALLYNSLPPVQSLGFPI